MADPNRAKSIFLTAAERPAGGPRTAYVAEACGPDADLRREVDELLAHFECVGSFLEMPGPGSAPAAGPPAEAVGARIGPYKLLEVIGEGGFGIVFMAEQTRPVCRLVALKVLKPGMDTRQVIARFEAERQALALMDHPHIARVFDGGETAAGRPYFVMELVRGAPVTAFCDQSRLPVRDRLALFVTVCRAVQHAHQKGVIHRDIKPSNVLVTMHDTSPVAKVIDFGIAKALGQRLTDKTLYTGFAQMVGTPMYMSPEQAQMSGLDVDTRADVYALGVLLYELLTGSTPFDKERLATAGYDEVRRIIREEDPPKPSTRLSTLGPAAAATVSAGRGSDPRRLSQLVRGELDWIVMKCLEKDRSRRYESAGALAADVERNLRDEPVQACPPTALYRVRKFARRNKRALATAALAGLVLLAALGVAAGGIGWAARDRAARQTVLDERAALALDEAATAYDRGNRMEALAALKRAEALLAGDAGRADLRERARRWRADLTMVGRLEEIRLRQSGMKEGGWFHHAAADPEYVVAFQEYGLDVTTLDPDAAAAIIRDSAIREPLVAALDDWLIWVKPREDTAGRDRLLAIVRRADPDDWRNRFRDSAHGGDQKVLEQLADRPEAAGLAPTSAVLLGRALQSVRANQKSLAVLLAAQERHPTDFWLNVEVGAVLLWKLKPPRAPEAAGYFRAALALRPDNAAIYCNLAGALQLSPNAIDQAIAAYRRAVELRPDYVRALEPLGGLYGRKGAWAEAIAAYREGIRISPGRADPHNNLGVVLHRAGRRDEALVEMREAVRLAPNNALFRHNLGVTLMEMDLLDEAVEEYREALRLKSDYAEAHSDCGIALYRNGRLDEAIAEYRSALRLKSDDAVVHNNLGVALREAGRLDESIASCRQAIALDPKVGRFHYNLGLALEAQGDRRGAIAAYRDAAATYAKAVESAPRNANHLNNLAWLLVTCPAAEVRDPTRALGLARAAVELTPNSASYWNTLGAAHYRVGDWQAALAALEKGFGLRRRPHSDDGFFLAMVHYRLGDRDQARHWYDRALTALPADRLTDGDRRRLRAEAAELLGIRTKGE
jgi:serine/threonine protein kinase/Flp pilus assembly protein TadD